MTQRAWLVVRRGKPNKSVIMKDVFVPSQLREGEVLVKVHAGALNPVGYKMMGFLPNFAARRPHVAEHDIAGVVVDPNGSAFRKGDEIFGWFPVTVTLSTGQGALAEYTRIRADHLAHKPTVIDFVQAAGIPLAAMTAYQGLRLAKLDAGQTILINGGSTSVGSFAIQMAKVRGCRVVSSCSTTNIELVKNIGADEVIDYTLTPVAQQYQNHPPNPQFDAIFDAVGSSAELYTSSPTYLKRDGVFVSVGILSGGIAVVLGGFLKTTIWPGWLGGTRRQHRTIAVRNYKADLDAIGDLVAEGNVKPLVDSTYAFEDVHKAYDRIMTGRAKGKVIVTVIP
ncbi:NAD(P)-binding protein [Ramaria rubella]|nr:NAD(P)-binding protein [Ramaria rubella]